MNTENETNKVEYTSGFETYKPNIKTKPSLNEQFFNPYRPLRP